MPSVSAELPIRIRDPIHGTVRISRSELKLVNHSAYQRLRFIKQLGLADYAYPGATHTRYAHGLRHDARRDGHVRRHGA